MTLPLSLSPSLMSTTLSSKPSSKFATPPSMSLFIQPNISAFAPSPIAPTTTEQMSFLSSAHTPSSMSTPSSPLRQCHVFPLFLLTNAAYLLYTAVIDISHLLHALEDDPLYQEDTITHELIHLFHGISQAQRLLSAETTEFPLRFALDALPNHILSILHTHNFATFVEQIPPTTTYPTFPYPNNLNNFFFTILDLIPLYLYRLPSHPDCTFLLLLTPLWQLNQTMTLTSPTSR